MEKYEILKERTHLFAPNINVVMRFDITPAVTQEQFTKAVTKAMEANEILMMKIIIEKDGRAYYESTGTPVIQVEMTNESFETVLTRQQKIVFDLEHGELVRFFLNESDGRTSIYLVAHHLAGDGLSMTYFIDDILNALAGNPLTFKKMKLFSSEALPKDSELKFLMNVTVNSLNKKWLKSGKVFDFKDYHRMFDQYWMGRESRILTDSITLEQLKKIKERAKRKNVTINTVLTTALIYAEGDMADTGFAISTREKNETVMGNYTTGISIKYRYDTAKSFWENCIRVHGLICEKLDHVDKKYFLNRFMDKLDQTLIDSAYFAAFDSYENKTAKATSKMFGYTGNARGLGISNLGMVLIEKAYGDFEVNEFVFAPPLIPNAKKIYGLATFGDKLTLTLHLQENEQTEHNLMLFEKAVEILNTL